MGIDSFAYRAVLVVHVLAAIVGFGGVVLNGLYASDARQRHGEAGLAVQQANWKATLVAEKLIYVVLLAGLALVVLSDGAWGFGDTWVWLSIVAFVVALGVSHGVLIPTQRAMLRETRVAVEKGGRPDDATMAALMKKVRTRGPVLHLLLVVLLVLMVWKPGS